MQSVPDWSKPQVVHLQSVGRTPCRPEPKYKRWGCGDPGAVTGTLKGA